MSGVPILTPPRDTPINLVLPLLWSIYLFKTVMAVIRDKTKNVLKAEGNVMLPIASGPPLGQVRGPV